MTIQQCLRFMCASLTVVSLVASSSPAPASAATTDATTADTGVEAAVALINFTRKASGLPGVEVDPELSEAASAHARYLELNKIDSASAGLGLHDEDLGLPGASVLGRDSAAASAVVLSSNALDAARVVLALPLHRRGILQPQLERIGVGTAASFTVFNVQDGVDYSTSLLDRPVVYPFDGQQDVPLAFVPGEIPDVLQATPVLQGAPVGFPLSVEPSCGELGTPTRIELRNASANAAVPFWVVAPGTTLQAIGGTRMVEQVVVVPQAPLVAGNTYQTTVEGTCADQTYAITWSFTAAGRLLKP